MDLQQYVTEVIEAAGGLVMPVEYALCYALIPEEMKEIFHGREEASLAFDYETAQENPESEFVTFGSYLLDSLMRYPSKKAISLLRYAVIDKIGVSNPEDKIMRKLNLRRAGFKIVKEQSVLSPWILFTLKTVYTSDEIIEQIEKIWVDTVRGTFVEHMEDFGIFYNTELKSDLMVPDTLEIKDAYKTAYDVIKKKAEAKAKRLSADKKLGREIERITDYYEDLQEENTRRMERKGISEQRIAELKDKSASLVLERDHQIREMTAKYSVKAEVYLENGVIYFIPEKEYTINITDKGMAGERKLYYNHIIKDILD